MKRFFALLIVSIMVIVFCVNAFALPLNRQFQDIKLPTQVILERQAIDNPTVADSTGVLNASAGATSAAAATISTGFTNPDVPRNLVLTPGGTTADVAGCTVTVSGTNIFNRAITETFVVPDNHAAGIVGSKAFKTVTSLSLPANCEEGGFDATWSLGRGEKLGLKRCMDYAGNWAWSTVGGVYESTRATITADADEIEKNTADFNGTMNGTADFQGFFIQNFRCFP